MNRVSTKVVSMLLCVVMLVGVVPTAIFAGIDYTAHDDYYKVISKDDFDLAPGITESEIVLNNVEGTHRQVAHVVEVDLNNPYTKVVPSYKGMVPTPGKYGVQIMSQQAAWAEANGYGNVVAAMNLSLSWYDSAYYVEHPELVGEPLGYMILDGEVYMNSNGQTSGAQTCVVINFDEKNGEARPADMPKVEIRSTSSAITGWEEQVIPANFGFLVKDGKNQYGKDNNAANGASRSFVGIKEDGTFVMVMNDGRQSPYSAGFTNYEMAEFMLSLGCVQAVNGDGGGSSAFLSQRPGEELKINCSPSDGAERPTTHGILVISTAPATGEFVRANISAENDYYTPGSTVKFSAIGTDLVGTVADIPADATWQLSDPSMGTIENGVFVSNGKLGTAVAQMIWNGNVVGEASVEIVIPTEFSFTQTVMTVPFDKEITIGIKATINGGLNDVVIKDSDIVLEITNDKLGTFNGLKFTSVSEANAPADLTSTLKATFVHDTSLVATASFNLGKGSEVLFDFEDASDIDEWNIADVNGNDQGFYQHLSYATAEDGQVHDGVGSMRVEMNPISANNISAGGYGQSDLFLDNAVVVENAKSIGFWAYIPDEYEHCWIRVLYWYDPDGDGKFDKKNTITVINQPEVYNNWSESGWKYFSVDVSAYKSVLIPGLDAKDKIAYTTGKPDANNFRFIEFMFPHTNTNDLWKTYGTINGLQTVYVDNITADFSDAVDDREAPIFSKVELAGNDTGIELKNNSFATTNSNVITVTATVNEDTKKTNATGLDTSSIKAYVDGVAVNATFANNRITISDIAVADGMHRVKFEICDNMGNKSVVVRLVKVESGVDASTVQVVPKDATLDKLYGGSVYWMDVNATDIETIQSVTAKIDLNYGNHFELDHVVLAEGFTSSYTIDEENNTATITITRTGDNTQTGEATLASLPIRVIYYDTDINIEGYTAETYWNTYEFWPYDLKVDVDMGAITYVEGYASDVLGAFSNEEFSVDTEIYCPSASMDAAYKAEKGTAHVHTPVAVNDKAATCTEAGYTGRTYCEVCASVVDWGTEVSAAGHTWTVDGVLKVCACGAAISADGLVGWQNINGVDYYFDADSNAVDGKYTVDGHTYTFEKGKLVDAAWEKAADYTVCWWAGKKIENTWFTVNGKTYYFIMDQMCTGIQKVAYRDANGNRDGYRYYIFADDGVWMEDYTGFFTNGIDSCWAENGIAAYKGLCQDAEGNYYYMNSQYLAIKNCTYSISEGRANGLLPAGKYAFGADGKMLNPPSVEPDVPVVPDPTPDPEPEEPDTPVTPEPEKPEVKSGLIHDDDGEIRFYENGVALYKGLVQDEDGNYYYINSGKKAVKNCTYSISEGRANGLLPAGKYAFGADGKMLNPPSVEPDVPVVPDPEPEEPDVPVVPDPTPDPEPEEPDTPVVPEEPAVKNGLIKDEDGNVRFYENGVAIYKGLVQDEDGNYYYINSGKKAVKSCTYSISEGRANGLLPAGTYEFGADGKMINPPSVEPEEPDTPVVPDPTPDPEPEEPDTPVVPEEPAVKNGLVKDEDGHIRFYENGVAIYKGLVQDEDGNYYYINSGKKAVKNCTYSISEGRANGLLPAGKYAFDAEGKLILN